MGTSRFLVCWCRQASCGSSWHRALVIGHRHFHTAYGVLVPPALSLFVCEPFFCQEASSRVKTINASDGSLFQLARGLETGNCRRPFADYVREYFSFCVCTLHSLIQVG